MTTAQRARRFISRTCHPVFGNVIRCGHGHFHRKGEETPCAVTFYSASDPEVLTEQVTAAGWTRRRARVPKAFQESIGKLRVTQYLCPQHSPPKEPKTAVGKVAA